MDARKEFEAICDALEESNEGVVRICKRLGASRHRFYNTMNASPELRDRFARSKQMQAEYIDDLMREIARNEPDVQRAKLMVYIEEKQQARLDPAKYAPKTQIDVTSGGEVINPLMGAEIATLALLRVQLESGAMALPACELVENTDDVDA